MGMKFYKVVEILGNAEVNIVAAREHMGEVERTVRTVKESGRGIFNTISYSYLPSQIIIHLLYFILMWLNALPTGKGIFQKYSTS